MNGAASTIGLNFAAAMPSARVFGHPQPKMSWEDWSGGAEVPDISSRDAGLAICNPSFPRLRSPTPTL
jgi:hypothetical protein